MDSEVMREGRLMDIIDEKWASDKLPDDDIEVPALELPDAEPDNANSQETLKEQDQKWTDLALSNLHEHPPQASNS
ncbi:hypothetical protein CHUAL_001690 [Chamberlinius hualienensis]